METQEPGGHAASDPSRASNDPRATYWRSNVRVLGILLSLWFLVSFGFGVLAVEPLNRIRIPGTGFKLGFWFAQQGSIYVFVAIIFAYVWRMNALDREFGVDEANAPPSDSTTDEPVRRDGSHA